MKSILTSMAIALSMGFAHAQEGYHEHDGFFLSMAIGPATGPVLLEASGTGFRELEFSGGGAILDVKIGGTIAKTLTLSFDVIGRSITGPELKMDGVKGSTPDNVSASDNLMGLGFTYYFMPVNIFLSGTVGVAKFILQDDGQNTNANSENGFGMQIKAGKEWWVGANWGLGVSGGFAYSAADDKGDPSNSLYKGELSTQKLFLMFNVTYN